MHTKLDLLVCLEIEITGYGLVIANRDVANSMIRKRLEGQTWMT